MFLASLPLYPYGWHLVLNIAGGLPPVTIMAGWLTTAVAADHDPQSQLVVTVATPTESRPT